MRDIGGPGRIEGHLRGIGGPYQIKGLVWHCRRRRPDQGVRAVLAARPNQTNNVIITIFRIIQFHSILNNRSGLSTEVSPRRAGGEPQISRDPGITRPPSAPRKPASDVEPAV